MMPNSLKVRFKKLIPEAVMPYRGSKDAAGYDLTAVRAEEISDGRVRLYTGLAVEIPKGYAGFIFPRSSIYKNACWLTNSVGVIDSDYRGEVCAIFATWDAKKVYKVGERFGQMVILPVPEVEYIEAETLSSTERGAGGYGSTGK